MHAKGKVADPRVELQDGPVRQDMLAREVTGDEKAVWWARAIEAFPGYAEHQTNTDREIPVLVLSQLPSSTDMAHRTDHGARWP